MSGAFRCPDSTLRAGPAEGHAEGRQEGGHPPPRGPPRPPPGRQALFRKQKSLIGLDLGSQTLKAIEISLDGAEPVITGFARVEIPAGSERSVALGQLCEQGKFRSKAVVTGVAGQNVVVRYISMVPMSDAELRQAIRFESDKYLPFDAQDVVLDCQRLERRTAGEGEAANEEQISVVLVACQKSVIHSQLQEVILHGLQPSAVDVDVFALANAWELSSAGASVAEDGTPVGVALVDVGALRTQINVLLGAETCFSREIGIAGGDMTQAIARRLGLELFEAEAVKRTPGEREVEVARAISPVLEDLVSEISLSLDYVENREGVRVEEVLLSGGGALAPGAVDFIEQALGRPTRVWNPLEGLRVDADRVNIEELEASAASLAVAIGLASRVRAA
ncbi:MAG: type IV pilus assembly protein PilM [Planctomycetaceae bacterium]|nr:type IV pilus assembly protein PilM [Planctomycetaceae bacterium]